MLLECKIKKLKPNAQIPTWAYQSAAGADLYACLNAPVVEIPPHTTVSIPLGFSTEFAPGYAALLYARSGMAIKRDISPANKVGVVDADYRGEWLFPARNDGNEPQFIQDGERIGQVIFHEVEHPTFVEVDDLSDTERGVGGFGSSGTK